MLQAFYNTNSGSNLGEEIRTALQKYLSKIEDDESSLMDCTIDIVIGKPPVSQRPADHDSQKITQRKNRGNLPGFITNLSREKILEAQRWGVSFVSQKQSSSVKKPSENAKDHTSTSYSEREGQIEGESKNLSAIYLDRIQENIKKVRKDFFRKNSIPKSEHRRSKNLNIQKCL